MTQVPEQTPPAIPARLTLGAVFILTVVTLGTYLPQSLGRSAWQNDEIRICEVSREMQAYGHWLVPHLNGEVYSEKPPLFNWMICGAAGVVGDAFDGGHLIQALFVALGAIAVAGIGVGTGLLSGTASAVLAGMLYAVMQGVGDRAVQIVFDPIVTGFTLLAVWSWVGYARGRRPTLAWIGAALAVAGGALTKGPVALLHVALGCIAVHLTIRAFRLKDGLAFLLVLGVGALAPMLWVWVAAQQVGWWFWTHMTVEQTAGRLSGPAPHAEPIYHYFRSLPLALMPAMLVLPGAVVLARGTDRREAGGRAVRALGLWFVAGFVIFSLIAAKRVGYVLPLLAPAALVAAFGVMRARTAPAKSHGRRMILLPLGVAAVLALIGGAGVLIGVLLPADLIAPRIARVAAVPESFWSPGLRGVIGTAVLLVLPLSWMTLRFVRQGRPDRATFALLGALCLALAVGGGGTQRALEPWYSPRAFVEQAVERVPAGERLFLYPYDMQGRVSLFGGLERVPVLYPHTIPKTTPYWVIAPKRNWDHAPASLLANAHVAYSAVIRRRTYLLVRVD